MAAPTKVASAIASTVLVAPSTRRRVFMENSDANRLHVLLGSGTATTTDYSFSLAQYENCEIVDYSGEIKGIWAADGAGFALITEIGT